jgi:putative transposase
VGALGDGGLPGVGTSRDARDRRGLLDDALQTPPACSASPRARLRDLAAARVSYGYLRLYVLLRREGWRVNHKRVYRLYREEGLALQRRRPKRRRSAMPRSSRHETTRPNERWAMDFMQDVLGDGRSMRVFTLVDAHTRECLALEAAARFRGAEVAAILSSVIAERGAPIVIQCDQGTEFTSIALDQWAYWNKVQLDFSRRGTPGDNAVCEAFNGSVRRECLSQAYFLSYVDAQHVLENWKTDYNNHRPHSSLQDLSPAHFRARESNPEAVSERSKQPA